MFKATCPDVVDGTNDKVSLLWQRIDQAVLQDQGKVKDDLNDIQEEIDDIKLQLKNTPQSHPQSVLLLNSSLDQMSEAIEQHQVRLRDLALEHTTQSSLFTVESPSPQIPSSSLFLTSIHGVPSNLVDVSDIAEDVPDNEEIERKYSITTPHDEVRVVFPTNAIVELTTQISESISISDNKPETFRTSENNLQLYTDKELRAHMTDSLEQPQLSEIAHPLKSSQNCFNEEYFIPGSTELGKMSSSPNDIVSGTYILEAGFGPVHGETCQKVTEGTLGTQKLPEYIPFHVQEESILHDNLKQCTGPDKSLHEYEINQMALTAKEISHKVPLGSPLDAINIEFDADTGNDTEEKSSSCETQLIEACSPTTSYSSKGPAQSLEQMVEVAPPFQKGYSLTDEAHCLDSQDTCHLDAKPRTNQPDSETVGAVTSSDVERPKSRKIKSLQILHDEQDIPLQDEQDIPYEKTDLLNPSPEYDQPMKKLTEELSQSETENFASEEVSPTKSNDIPNKPKFTPDFDKHLPACSFELVKERASKDVSPCSVMRSNEQIASTTLHFTDDSNMDSCAMSSTDNPDTKGLNIFEQAALPLSSLPESQKGLGLTAFDSLSCGSGNNDSEATAGSSVSGGGNVPDPGSLISTRESEDRPGFQDTNIIMDEERHLLKHAYGRLRETSGGNTVCEKQSHDHEFDRLRDTMELEVSPSKTECTRRILSTTQSTERPDIQNVNIKNQNLHQDFARSRDTTEQEVYPGGTKHIITQNIFNTMSIESPDIHNLNIDSQNRMGDFKREEVSPGETELTRNPNSLTFPESFNWGNISVTKALPDISTIQPMIDPECHSRKIDHYKHIFQSDPDSVQKTVEKEKKYTTQSHDNQGAAYSTDSNLDKIREIVQNKPGGMAHVMQQTVSITLPKDSLQASGLNLGFTEPLRESDDEKVKEKFEKLGSPESSEHTKRKPINSSEPQSKPKFSQKQIDFSKPGNEFDFDNVTETTERERTPDGTLQIIKEIVPSSQSSHSPETPGVHRSVPLTESSFDKVSKTTERETSPGGTVYILRKIVFSSQPSDNQSTPGSLGQEVPLAESDFDKMKETIESETSPGGTPHIYKYIVCTPKPLDNQETPCPQRDVIFAESDFDTKRKTTETETTPGGTEHIRKTVHDSQPFANQEFPLTLQEVPSMESNFGKISEMTERETSPGRTAHLRKIIYTSPSIHSQRTPSLNLEVPLKEPVGVVNKIEGKIGTEISPEMAESTTENLQFIKVKNSSSPKQSLISSHETCEHVFALPKKSISKPAPKEEVESEFTISLKRHPGELNEGPKNIKEEFLVKRSQSKEKTPQQIVEAEYTVFRQAPKFENTSEGQSQEISDEDLAEIDSKESFHHLMATSNKEETCEKLQDLLVDAISEVKSKDAWASTHRSTSTPEDDGACVKMLGTSNSEKLPAFKGTFWKIG